MEACLVTVNGVLSICLLTLVKVSINLVNATLKMQSFL